MAEASFLLCKAMSERPGAIQKNINVNVNVQKPMVAAEEKDEDDPPPPIQQTVLDELRVKNKKLMKVETNMNMLMTNFKEVKMIKADMAKQMEMVAANNKMTAMEKEKIVVLVLT